MKGRTDNQVKNRYYSLIRPNLYKRPIEQHYPEPMQQTYYHPSTNFDLNRSVHSINSSSTPTSSNSYDVYESPSKKLKMDQSLVLKPFALRTVSLDNEQSDYDFDDLSFPHENKLAHSYNHHSVPVSVSNPESPCKEFWNEQNYGNCFYDQNSTNEHQYLSTDYAPVSPSHYYAPSSGHSSPVMKQCSYDLSH